MPTITLEQLSAENTEEGKAAEDLNPETSETELEAVAEETEVETDSPGEVEAEETNDETVEAFMQTEAEDSDEKQQKKGPSFKGLRQKMQGKIAERDERIDSLEAEVSALRKGPGSLPKVEGLPPRPKREDFGLDDDAYDEAVDAWNDAKFDSKLKSHTDNQAQKNSVSSKMQAIDTAVNQHYEAVEKLVAEGKVTEAEYHNADQEVRSAIEEVLTKRGDIISDVLISRL